MFLHLLSIIFKTLVFTIFVILVCIIYIILLLLCIPSWITKRTTLKAKDVEGDNKIVLFHGPVNKAQTDIGYTVSSNSFKVDMFDGFDMQC